MLKPPASALALLFAACVSAGGQGNRPRAEVNRARGRAPLALLDSTREGDGLKGPVRRIETEVVGVEMRGGRALPKPPSLLERTLYDERGRRVENETYPVVGDRVGQESHRYDERGNVAETLVLDAGGAVLSRTRYEYEFDAHGNWIKMTAAVAVSNAGRVEYEPTEITRRVITYYLIEEPRGHTASGAAPAASGGAPAEAAKVSTRAGASSGAETAKATTPPTTNGRAAGDDLRDGGVLNDRATWLPRPAFPVGGERLKEPFTVSVEVVVDITGRVVSARALGGPQPLRDSAERAARLATFLPLYVAGRPVKARGVINYAFNFLP